jgi:hypothetical protein
LRKLSSELAAASLLSALHSSTSLANLPESGGSPQLIINAGRYGLTRGGVAAENIELTPEGLKAVDDQVSAREQARTRIALAIEGIESSRTRPRRRHTNLHLFSQSIGELFHVVV